MTNQLAVKRDERGQIEVEQSLETLSYWLDDAIRVPVIGWRFGADALIGLIPGIGDMATTLVSFYILAAAIRYRVPKITILRMALNIIIDYVVGAIPVLGDAFDFAWKSNKMNLELIKRRARVGASDANNAATGDWLFVAGVMLFLLLVLVGSILLEILLVILLWRALNY